MSDSFFNKKISKKWSFLVVLLVLILLIYANFFTKPAILARSYDKLVQKYMQTFIQHISYNNTLKYNKKIWNQVKQELNKLGVDSTCIINKYYLSADENYSYHSFKIYSNKNELCKVSIRVKLFTNGYNVDSTLSNISEVSISLNGFPIALIEKE